MSHYTPTIERIGVAVVALLVLTSGVGVATTADLRATGDRQEAAVPVTTGGESDLADPATVTTGDSPVATATAPAPDDQPKPFVRSDGRPSATGVEGAGLSIEQSDQPLTFVPNRGQFGDDVAFAVRGSGRVVRFTDRSVVFREHDPATDGFHSIHLEFDGARSAPVVEGLDERSTVAHFYRGADSDDWYTDLPTYSRIAYRGLYPGIDLVYGGENGVVKSEFVVAPGVDPDAIRMNYSDASAVTVGADGSLIVDAGPTNLIEEPPVVYQVVDGERVDVDARYELAPDGTVGFTLGSYDADRALVIDPAIEYLVPTYSTYLGSIGTDTVAYDAATDDEGNVYVTGTVLEYPGINVFLARYDRHGELTLLASIGGNGTDMARSIAVGSDGAIYLAGETWSADFPTKAAYQPTIGDSAQDPSSTPDGIGGDGFLLKLDDPGTINYSTYLGGQYDDEATDVAVDSAGNAYVTGATNSHDVPLTSASQSQLNLGRDPSNGDWLASSDAFVGQFDATGQPAYLTYLGGNESDEAYGIDVGPTGSAYVTGYTQSRDFPIDPGSIQNEPGDPAGGITWDAFVAEFGSPTGNLTHSTYLGGYGQESGRSIAVDADDNIYVAGYSLSDDYPIVDGYQANRSRNTDAVLTRLNFSRNSTGGEITYSTYLGGDRADFAYEVVVIGETAYLVGEATPNFPVENAFQPDYGGASYEYVFGTGTQRYVGDAFVARVDTASAGNDSLVLSSYLGGSDGERGYGIAVDANDSVYVTGITYSDDYPTKLLDIDADPPHHSGGFEDAFVTKLSPSICATDPDDNGNPDNDGDGLCDDWELNGIDSDGDGVIDLPLHEAPYGADPDRKDVFVEVDYMSCKEGMSQTARAVCQRIRNQKGSPHVHGAYKPHYRTAFDRVERAFNDSPVANPDGSTGVNLHVMVDEPVPEITPIIFDGNHSIDPNATPANTTFDDLKSGSSTVDCDGYFGTAANRTAANCADVLAARDLAFHYAVFGHDHAHELGSGGAGELPGNDFMVTLNESFLRSAAAAGRTWNTSAKHEWIDVIADSFMHELGHNLGLRHGGGDHVNLKPNYLSVMNYAFTDNEAGSASLLPGISDGTAVRTNRPLDYSRANLPPLNESDLDETAAIGSAPSNWNRTAFFANGTSLIAPASGGFIDWNNDSRINFSVSAELNNESVDPIADNETLRGHDDWANLQLDFRQSEDYAARSHASAGRLIEISGPDRTVTEYIEGMFPSEDVDRDGVPNVRDNCIAVANPSQADRDGDGVGDACEPTADVTLSTEHPVAGLSIRFTADNVSVTDGTEYRWEFDDGTTATGRSVTHTYATAGEYDVNLTLVIVDRLSETVTTAVPVVAESDQPAVDAALATTVNNVDSPIRVSVTATDANGSVTEIALLHRDGTRADSVACGAASCRATLNATVAASTWNETAETYGSTDLVVRAVNDAGQVNLVRVPVTVFVPGDATGDGAVDVFDAVPVGHAWQSVNGDARYADAADLNNDGVVDATDLSILRANWKAAAGA